MYLYIYAHTNGHTHAWTPMMYAQILINNHDEFSVLAYNLESQILK